MRRLSFMPLAILIAGCSSATDTDTAAPLEPARDFTAHELHVSDASARFAFELLHAVHADVPDDDILLSPLSASMALGMTVNGAAGETRAAMKATLGLGGLDDAALNEAYRGLIAQLRARDARVEFGLANSLWHEQSFPVEPAFIGTVEENFGAEVAALDFSDPASVRTINSWAARETGNRIRDLLDHISPLERLFLINAVYFKAPWTQPFEEGATRPRDFTTASGAVVQVPTMMRDAATRFLDDDGVHMVELPYADSAFSMVLAMPVADADVAGFIDGMTAERFAALRARARVGRLMLFLPKFRFDFAADLSDPLRGMGMDIAFDPARADFSRINPLQQDLHVSRVQQKAFIDVHERGTEAAAATVVGVGVTSMPPAIAFDRPFLFAIIERSSRAVLFIGRVADPR